MLKLRNRELGGDEQCIVVKVKLASSKFSTAESFETLIGTQAHRWILIQTDAGWYRQRHTAVDKYRHRQG